MVYKYILYEGYAIARTYAELNKELIFLNPSQELFAIGLGNIVGSVSSAFPVAGSFTRTAVAYETGSKTPITSIICIGCVVLVVSVLGPYLYYIPYAALSAIICVALYNNIGISEAADAWKSSNTDALMYFSTLIVTFTFSTTIGLVVGVLLSLVIFLHKLVFSERNSPQASLVGKDSEGILWVRFNCDLSFLSTTRIRDYFFTELIHAERLKAIVIDFTDVKHIDLSAIKALCDVSMLAKELKAVVNTINVLPHIRSKMDEFELFTAEVGKVSKRKAAFKESLQVKLQRLQSQRTSLGQALDISHHKVKGPNDYLNESLGETSVHCAQSGFFSFAYMKSMAKPRVENPLAAQSNEHLESDV